MASGVHRQQEGQQDSVMPPAAIVWNSSPQRLLGVGVDLHGQGGVGVRRAVRGTRYSDMAAPTRISGAVSPMARDSARIVPVMIAPARPTAGRGRGPSASASPPAAQGRPPQRVRHRPQRASCVAMTTTGRTSKASVSPPAQSDRLERPGAFVVEGVAEGGQAQQAVDHRRHPGEVGDVRCLDRCTRNRPAGANSSRKTAAPTPIGMASAVTNPSSQRVPTTPFLEAVAGRVDRRHPGRELPAGSRTQVGRP